MKYSFKPIMYLCVCVSAFLFSYYAHEQPCQSAGPAHSHAPVLLWISSCLWSCWLHPWHAHTGFHGSRGETFFICIVVSSLPLTPHLCILVHNGFALNSHKKETSKTNKSSLVFQNLPDWHTFSL